MRTRSRYLFAVAVLGGLIVAAYSDGTEEAEGTFEVLIADDVDRGSELQHPRC